MLEKAKILLASLLLLALQEARCETSLGTKLELNTISEFKATDKSLHYYITITDVGREVAENLIVQYSSLSDKLFSSIACTAHPSNATEGKGVSLTNEMNALPNVFFVSKKALQKACPTNCQIKVVLNLNKKLAYKNKNGAPFKLFANLVSFEKISLKEHAPLSFPASSKSRYTFEVASPEGGYNASGVNINLINRVVPMVMRVTLSGPGVDGEKQVTKTYLTGDIWTNVIHVPYSDLKQIKTPKIEFTVGISDQDKTSIAQVEDDKFQSLYWWTVEVSVNFQTLPSAQPKVGFVSENMFSYFSFTKSSKNEALVLLHVLEGEADLYIKRGDDIFPDINTYDFKSATYKDDEVRLPSSPGDEVQETYVIGVYGTLKSKFRLTATDKAKIKYFPVKEGEIVRKHLKKGEKLILSLEVSLETSKKLFVGFSGDQGKVLGYAKSYNENIEEFLNQIPTSKDFDLGINQITGLIRRAELPSLTIDEKGGQHWLVSIESQQVSQTVTCFVTGSNENPLQLKGGEQITDSLEKGSRQNYYFQFDNEILEEVLSVTLQDGTIVLRITDNEKLSDDPDPLVLEFAAVDHTVQKDIDLRKSKTSRKDIGFFRGYLVQVTAKSNTVFSLMSRKSGSQLKPMIPGQFVFFTYDNKNKNAFYYKIEADDNLSSLKVVFEMKNMIPPTGKDQKKFDNSVDLLQHTEFFFISEEYFGKKDSVNNNKIQANIIGNVSTFDSERNQYAVKLAPMAGYLIIQPRTEKVIQGDDSFMVLMQLVLNNTKNIPINTRKTERAFIGTPETYLLHIPKESEVSMQVSACSGGDLSISIMNQNKEPESPDVNISSRSEAEKILSSHKFSFYAGTTSKLLSITVTVLNTTKNEASTFSIVTSSNSLHDKITLQEFLKPNPSVFTPLVQGYNATLRQDPNFVEFQVAPFVLPQGFEARYPAIRKYKVEYLTYFSNELPKIFGDENVCDVDVFAGKESYVWTKQMFESQTLNNPGEKFDRDFPPYYALQTPGYPKTNPPYYGVVNVKVVLYQNDASEVSTDAQVIYRYPFIIENRPVVKTIALTSLIIVVILVLLYFLLRRRCTKMISDTISKSGAAGNTNPEGYQQTATHDISTASSGIEL